MFRFACLFAVTALTVVPVAAHHSPPTITEIEWNPESQRFEVAMKLPIPDLQDAISGQLNKRFGIENSDREEQLRDYISEHFSVVFKGDDECRLRWVGCELQLHDVWVYFEAESVSKNKAAETEKSEPATNRWQGFLRPSHQSDSIRSVVIRNSCLLKVHPQQQNVVRLKYGSSAETKTLTAKLLRVTFE